MKTYGFWNNKGGTGKTSLAFQTVCMFSEENDDKNILAVDLCPQANLSELFLGGLLTRMKPGKMKMPGKDVQIKADYLQNALDAMKTLVSKI